MVAVSFRCGHGAVPSEQGVVALPRLCPLCMLLDETHRSRAELLRRVAPPARAALARETRIGAEYEWRCAKGHDRYPATVREVLTGTGCAKCRANATAPGALQEAGVAFMKPGLKVGTSMTEQRLRMLLGERIRLHHRVNAVRIARTFFGRQEVWPDILVPALRIAVEYDDPGRSRRAHRGLKEASDLEKDEALREVGWEVIRIRGGGLHAVGPYSLVCSALTAAVVDDVVACMRKIRGDAAVDAIMVSGSAPSDQQPPHAVVAP
jgi:very-short-patch-repair endonuclease